MNDMERRRLDGWYAAGPAAGGTAGGPPAFRFTVQ